MTYHTITTYPVIKLIDPDKKVSSPAKYRINDKRAPSTRRHNKAVLYRRG